MGHQSQVRCSLHTHVTICEELLSQFTVLSREPLTLLWWMINLWPSFFHLYPHWIILKHISDMIINLFW